MFSTITRVLLFSAFAATGCGGSPPRLASNTNAEPNGQSRASDSDAGPAAVAQSIPAPLEPIAADLPTVSVAQLRTFHASECASGICASGASPSVTTVTLPRVPDVPASVTGWFQVIAPGATLRIPRRTQTDFLGVVLAGRASITVTGDGRPASQQIADAWTAFLLPEGGVDLRAAGTEPIGLALVIGRGSAGSTTSAIASGPRSRGGLILRPMTALPDLAWAGGAFHARIAFEAPESPNASLEILMGTARGPVAEHDHPNAAELLMPLSAAGSLRVPAQVAPGTSLSMQIAAQEIPVMDGTVVLVPAAERHAWEPAGSRPLIAIQSYSPPGAEQRFRTLAAPPR